MARILLVDDEPLVRESVSLLLAADGHDVSVAPGGREALLEFSEGRFDLVITDLKMPVMRGDALAAEIKKKAPETPVILLTAHAEMLGDAPELSVYIDKIVHKPFRLEALRSAMDSVGRK